MKKVDKISAEEFDRIFDEGEEDVMQYFDMSTVRRSSLRVRRKLGGRYVTVHKNYLDDMHKSKNVKRKKRRELHG